MKKKLVITLPLFVLLGCGEKDAQYYYDNLEELKVALKTCENKVKEAKTEAEIDQLVGDATCKAATIAAAGVAMGDLKKAILAEEKFGWKATLESEKMRRQREIERKERQKKLAAEKAEKEKADKIAAEKYREENAGIAWDIYLNDSSKRGCYGKTKLCETKRALWDKKIAEGKKHMETIPYQTFLEQKSQYCGNAGSYSCQLWKGAEYDRYTKEVEKYLANEEKLRADYQACQKSVSQYSFYDENSKYMAAERAHPCPIVRKAAEKNII